MDQACILHIKHAKSGLEMILPLLYVHIKKIFFPGRNKWILKLLDFSTSILWDVMNQKRASASFGNIFHASLIQTEGKLMCMWSCDALLLKKKGLAMSCGVLSSKKRYYMRFGYFPRWCIVLGGELYDQDLIGFSSAFSHLHVPDSEKKIVCLFMLVCQNSKNSLVRAWVRYHLSVV